MNEFGLLIYIQKHGGVYICLWNVKVVDPCNVGMCIDTCSLMHCSVINEMEWNVLRRCWDMHILGSFNSFCLHPSTYFEHFRRQFQNTILLNPVRSCDMRQWFCHSSTLIWIFCFKEFIYIIRGSCLDFVCRQNTCISTGMPFINIMGTIFRYRILNVKAGLNWHA